MWNELGFCDSLILKKKKYHSVDILERTWRIDLHVLENVWESWGNVVLSQLEEIGAFVNVFEYLNVLQKWYKSPSKLW